jgi:D-arabinose 1-dehydrogenase-like Zn-dependent alcohol dehydrogenase
MPINAAILWEQGAPLVIEEAELEAPHAGEVLVEVKAAGVCHSDLHPARGDWPAKTPLVLGHEGPVSCEKLVQASLRFGRAITSSFVGRRHAERVRCVWKEGQFCVIAC